MKEYLPDSAKPSNIINQSAPVKYDSLENLLKEASVTIVVPKQHINALQKIFSDILDYDIKDKKDRFEESLLGKQILYYQIRKVCDGKTVPIKKKN